MMLYTSGTTGRPKGVPRRHRAERAAALAHVAQNLYARRAHAGRDAALSHHGRALAPRDGARRRRLRLPAAVRCRRRRWTLIERERVTNLYLVPTLYHDLLQHPHFARADTELRAQARLRRRADDRRAAEALSRRVPAGAVRQSLRLLGDLHLHHRPERAGKAGLRRSRRNQPAHPRGPARRPIRAASGAPGEEGEIIAAAAGDEAFEGYWSRPDADAKALRAGLVLHRRHRLLRRRRRPLRDRPGRRHDHHRRREHLAGRDRKRAVAAPGGGRGRGGRPAGRALGQDGHGLRQARDAPSSPRRSTHFCRSSGLPTSSARASTCSSRDPEIAGRQAPAPQAGGGRVRTARSELT